MQLKQKFKVTENRTRDTARHIHICFPENLCPSSWGTATWAARDHGWWQRVASTSSRAKHFWAKRGIRPCSALAKEARVEYSKTGGAEAPGALSSVSLRGGAPTPTSESGVSLLHLWDLKLVQSPGLCCPKGRRENTCNDLVLWANHELISNQLSWPPGKQILAK